MQVHGGMGYIEETGAAQHFRDARIAAIYEGTNGIQAIDLVARKVPLEGGKTVALYIDELRRTVKAVQASNAPAFGETAARLGEAVDSLERATQWLLAQKVVRRRAGRRDALSATVRQCRGRLHAGPGSARVVARKATAPAARCLRAFSPKISRCRQAASNAVSPKAPTASPVRKPRLQNNDLGTMPMSLKGKTLFITGGSRGIGLAIALKAARGRRQHRHRRQDRRAASQA